MAYLDINLTARPNIGLPQFRQIYVPQTSVAGAFSGFRFIAGSQFGVDNYWRLNRGMVYLDTGGDVGDRKIIIQQYLDVEGQTQWPVMGFLGAAIAASSGGSLHFDGVGQISANVTVFGSGLIWDRVQAENIIIKGRDYLLIDCLAPLGTDSMYLLMEFEFMNRTWGIRERIDPTWQQPQI